MGIFDRLFTITQAAANELLDKLEDPAMMMNQYIRSMQEEIANAQHELLKQEAIARGLRQQALEASALAQQSEGRALEAIKCGQEASAREALAVKLHHEEKAKDYDIWHENAKRQIAELTIRLETAKAELPQLLKKREELINRMRQAEANSRTAMPSFSVGPAILDGGGASRGFQRMEEKIAQWEAHIEASRSPYATPGYSVPYGFSPVSPSAPSRDSLVDEQLELLRKKLHTDQE